MAQYKIRIDRLEKEEVKTTEYQKIADTGNEKDGKAIYGYVPTTNVIVEEEKIFECVVKDLNVDAVIKSIYKL